MENKLRIVIIDSGVEGNHPVFNDFCFSDKSGMVKDGEFFNSCYDTDELGHGTAIAGIIHKQIPKAELIVVKIFVSNELVVGCDNLVMALKYVSDHIECDIINMSLGTTEYSSELLEVCEQLYKKNIILVSAFDNAGAISFPAYFDSVIGIDSTDSLGRNKDYIYVEDSCVNLMFRGGNKRLAWKNGTYVLNQGTSFSAAYATAYIGKLLLDGCSPDNIRSILKENAVKCIKNEKNQLFYKKISTIPFKISKAAIFPFNKETESLVRLAEHLPFEIKAVYDERHFGNIGRIVSDFTGQYVFTVKALEQIELTDIDTLILGHTRKMSFMLQKQLRDEIIPMCRENNINVYAFDDETLNKYDKNKKTYIYYPAIRVDDFKIQNYGKLFHPSIPIICVMGTSAKQGKFTLQVRLHQILSSMGYSVGQVGTEPHSLLFGMDACIPYGYSSTVALDSYELMQAVNQAIFNVSISQKQPDLIITGGQSGTIPLAFGNIAQLPISQMAFLMAVMPDIVILCINADDDWQYIWRTIYAIEGITNVKVEALMVYPFTYRNGWGIMNDHKGKVSDIQDICQKIYKEFRIPTYTMESDIDLQLLCEQCIERLSGDE